jgi:hypothetical protein
VPTLAVVLILFAMARRLLAERALAAAALDATPDSVLIVDTGADRMLVGRYALLEECRDVLDRFFCAEESYRTSGDALGTPFCTIAGRISFCLSNVREPFA